MNIEAIAEYKTSELCHLGNFSEYAKIRREIKQAEQLLSKRSRIDNKQRAHLEQELSGYRRSMRSHPCHSCNEREQHARIAERADRLIRENEGLQARVENRTNVIAKTFDRIIEVLNQLNYLDGELVTPTGKALSKIYAESDLLISEVLNSGVLDKLSDIEIASALSIFLFESRKPEPPKIPNTNVQDALKEIVSIWSKLHNLESEYDVKTQREPDFGFCWMAFRWMCERARLSRWWGRAERGRPRCWYLQNYAPFCFMPIIARRRSSLVPQSSRMARRQLY